MSLDPILNFAKGTVSIGYDDTDTSIVLSSGDGANFPSSFSYNIVWYNSTDYPDPSDDPNVEIVRVTARSTDTLTVTRAQEGTAATTKNTASKTYKMILSFTKKTYDEIAPLASPTFTGTLTSATASLDGAVTINESGADVDFRVETLGDLNTIFARGSDGHVGIGASDPTYRLDVQSGEATFAMEINNTHPSAGFGFLVSGGSNNSQDILRLRDTGGANMFRFKAGGQSWLSSNVSIGTTAIGAMLHVDQSSLTGAIPVLYLDQADISEEMIEFNTTIGTGNAIEAIGAKSLTTTHFIKATITGVGTVYIPVGTIA
jgi:hypothetical protein